MKLYAVGVGPGDPELITLKAARLIASADVIFAPTGRGGHSLAQEIAAAHISEHQKLVLMSFPISRDNETLESVWPAHADVIAATLAASAGHTGVLLVEGDPSLYGSFNHLRPVLRERYPDIAVEVVPGVSSVMAAAAIADVPLAVRDEWVAILPSVSDRDLLMQLFERFATVVLLKASEHVDTVLEALEGTGRLDDAVWVRRVGWPEQQVKTDVRQLRGTRPDYFSLIIVRKHENTEPSHPFPHEKRGDRAYTDDGHTDTSHRWPLPLP